MGSGKLLGQPDRMLGANLVLHLEVATIFLVTSSYTYQDKFQQICGPVLPECDFP